MPIYEKHSFTNEKLPFIFKRVEMSTVSPEEEWANWHENIEMIFVTEGVADIRLDGVEISAKQGSAVIFNPNSLHAIGSRTRVVYYYLIVDRSFCVENFFDTNSLHFEVLVEDRELFNMFEAFEELYFAPSLSEFYIQRMRAKVLEILAVVCEKYSTASTFHYELPTLRFIKPALSYIYENCGAELSLDGVAEKVNISKYHFAREFKRVTGHTFVDYVNMIRCRQASKLLLQGDKSIAQISLECGFSSPSYFSRTFRQYVGVLPSEYRTRGTQKKL